jgi:sulfur relay protein TusB/DsrH
MTFPPDKIASCLHLVAGARHEALDDCLSHVDPADAVLFLDAGVLHLLRATGGPLGGAALRVQFMAADLRAHGLFDLARRVDADILDDAGFCGLLSAHGHCLTWT